MTTRRMPDGTWPIEFTAEAVSGDLKRERVARRNAGRRREASPSTGAPKLSREARAFRVLLDAARRGEPVAVQRLRDEYHAWVIPASTST